MSNENDEIVLPCEFIETDVSALRQLALIVARPGMLVADVGSWTGGSASCLAEIAARHNGKVFCIDHWKGNPGTQTGVLAEGVDVYSIFRKCITEAGLWNHVRPMVMDSLDAAGIFKDGVLDLVFIDADNRYDHVRKDIEAWLPKIRRGGILCGHDDYLHYSDYCQETRDMIDNSLDKNAILPEPDVCVHPGVTRALYDIFKDAYTKINNSSLWAVQIVPLSKRDLIIGSHPEAFKPDHKINAENCHNILLDVKEILDVAGIRFWLWFGTFLGVYRDSKLIPWDTDIDLAVYSEDLQKIAELEPLFVNKGFEFHAGPDAMLYRDGEHLDLSDFHLEGDERVSGHYSIDAADFEQDNYIEFLNRKWRIISNPERWLGYLYGHQWRTPKKDFMTPGRPLGEK